MNQTIRPTQQTCAQHRMDCSGLAQSQLDESKEALQRSEEVQDIMGRIPSKIEQWGITVIFAAVVLLLVGSYQFRYPETIEAEMTLTGSAPALPLVARSSGKLTGLKVEEGMGVEAGAVLATIENPAREADIANLHLLLSRYGGQPDSLYEQLTAHEAGWVLGEVQQAYTAFMDQLYETTNYYRVNYYSQKRKTLANRIVQFQKHKERMKSQEDIALRQYQLAQKGFERQHSLFTKNMISLADYEQSESKLLSSQSVWELARASVEQIDIQIGEMEENVLDLAREQADKESELRHQYHSVQEQLLNALESWSLAYQITAPVKGRITFSDYWSDNQTVQVGGEVFYIVPDEEKHLAGRAKLPISRSGKVREGQRVIVSFTNYPENEFGVVNGVVESISLVPSASYYTVEISFPHGLYTTYQQTLPLSYEMAATARIVTEDIRLIERLASPLKSLLHNTQQTRP